MTEAEDAELRQILSKVDLELMHLAHHFGRDQVSSAHNGLELRIFRSGQLVLGTDIETGDRDSHAAAFSVELWPAWALGERSGRPEWRIDASIDVDCQHKIDHEAMETVWSRQPKSAWTPRDAANELLAASQELLSLATFHPIDFWTSKATD